MIQFHHSLVEYVARVVHSVVYVIKFGAEFDNVKFAENSAHAQLSTYLPAVCSVLRVVAAPVA